jgi:hypothetical protein
MANKIKKAIEDSKRKRDFKSRDKGRKIRTQKKQKYEANRFVQRGTGGGAGKARGQGFKGPKGQPKREESDEEEGSEEEFNRVMQEEDEDLEKELADAQEPEVDDEEGDMEMNDAEFLEHADELDLPSEDEVADDEDDLKGEETDSDLEEYYRELGIETEPNEGDAYKKKKAKKATDGKVVVVPKEEARKKVLDDLIEKTRAQPNYTTITRVIKIVKQVFFAGQQSAEDEEGK